VNQETIEPLISYTRTGEFAKEAKFPELSSSACCAKADPDAP